tara:strand:+ start:925 stop:1038 length:114 start_codon:yes stop_codon:yes gene_type:complete
MNELIVGLIIGASTFATIILIYWIVSSDEKLKNKDNE